MPKKTILFLSHVPSLVGGGEKSLLELVKDAKKRGHECRVVVPAKGDLEKAVMKAGVPVTVVPYGWWGKSPATNMDFDGERLDNGRAIETLVQLIGREKPDLCVTNTTVVPYLAYAAAMTQVPHVWIVREFGERDLHLEFRTSAEDVYKSIQQLSDKVFANSQSLKQYLEEQMPELQGNGIGVIYPYVASPSMPDNFVSPFKDGVLRLAFVGQISQGKGQMDALKAVLQLKNKSIPVQICFVGAVFDKSYLKKMHDFIESSHLAEQVVFAGHQANPFGYVRAADVAVVCSENEAFGRVVVEAMLIGTPVVAPAAGGILEIIDNNKTGLLYRPGDAADLAGKIIALYKDAELSSRIAAQALKSVKDRYSIEHAHKAFFAFLEQAASRQRRALDLSMLSDVILYGKEKDRAVAALHAELQAVHKHARALQNELDALKNSRKWRFITSVSRVVFFWRR